jgi:hypothetical protein
MLAPRRASGLLGGAKPAAFTDQSLKRLQGINPLLADVLKETERRALESGIKIEVSEGLRDPARQQSLVAQGKSQTLRSKHLTGNAVDVHIRNPDGTPNWDFEAYRPVAEIAKAVAAEKGVPDLVWGGDWKTLKDGVHFQIGGASGKPNGGSEMRGGGGLLSMQGNPGADALQPQPQQPKSFMDRTFRDQDWRAKMAIALEGMTLNPNRGLIDVLGGEMKDRRETKKSDAAKNKTAAWLRSVGQGQLADALETGGVDAGAVVNAALQAMQPPDPMRALQMEKTQLELDQMRQSPQGKVMDVGGKLVRVMPDGSVSEIYAPPPPPQVTQVTGATLGLTGDDASKLFNVSPDGKVTAIGGGGTTVNIDQKAQGAFEEAFAKGDAQTLSGIEAAGMQAMRNAPRIARLGELLKSAPSGLVGSAKQIAGNFGIATEGLDELQAAQALISALVPEQRQPGSGPMSDKDLAEFKASLPRVINQPGGNEAIVKTMLAIAEYDAEGARIVQGLRSGSLTREQAFQALQSRPDPLAGFKVSAGAAPAGAAPSVRVYNPQTGKLE